MRILRGVPPLFRTLAAAVLAASVVPGSAVAAPQSGALLATGYNSNGQTGTGLFSEYLYTPMPVQGISNAVGGSGGYYTSIAVLADGTVDGWGYNYYGELGIGNTEPQRIPVQIPGLTEAVAAAAGAYHTLVLNANGTVDSMGWGKEGELGTGSTEESPTPHVIPGLSGVTQVAAGCYDSFAVTSGGKLYAWGYNNHGELGIGSLEQKDVPTEVAGLSEVAGVAASCTHTVVVLRNGTVKAFGENVGGDVNGSATKENVESPHAVPITGAKQVIAGDEFSGALLTDGTVKAWGANTYHEIGDGTTEPRLSPKTVPGVSGVTSISAGGYFTIVQLSNGTLEGWGYAADGELGIGKTEEVGEARILSFAHVIGVIPGGGYTYTTLFLTNSVQGTLSTPTLAFSGQIIGSKSTSQSVVVKNEGPARLAISGTSLAGSGAAAFAKTADGCSGATLVPGASCSIAYAFSPSAVGPAAASLTIASNSNSALVVSLSGTGEPHVPPVLGSLLLTSSAFKAARSGPSAVNAVAAGTYIIYGDSQAGLATFTVQRKAGGVYRGSGKARACVKAPAHPARGAKRCSYIQTLGTFTHADTAGTDALDFSGRVGGHALTPGNYQLSAVAVSPEGMSATRTAGFKIIR